MCIDKRAKYSKKFFGNVDSINSILTISIFSLLMSINIIFAQNPLIRDQFTADPTARVFEGKVYVYPSHDINCGTNWFCMEDYHVFSSENLVDWTDHGIIVSQDKVDWVDSNRNSMWAPDCFVKDGKYYFYFPAIADTNKAKRGMAIGVAVSDHPYGPFTPEKEPIKGVSGIDPNIFMDNDGQAYIYWAGRGGLQGAKLADNMLELEGEPHKIESFPKEGLREGPFLFERNGIYYFTFPRVIEKTEALVYATGDNPLGPFDYKGIFMDEHPSGCWTNHHSILEYKGQWYLFYHHNDLSPNFDKNRSIRADSLFFNEDGSIQKVIPTLRGVGVSQATEKIQIDRYSDLSKEGLAISFIDTTDTFAGWKTIFTAKDSWIKYNSVNFSSEDTKKIKFRVMSETVSRINVFIDGKSIVKIKIPRSNDWQVISKKIKKEIPSGIHNIKLLIEKNGHVEIDWIQFE